MALLQQPEESRGRGSADGHASDGSGAAAAAPARALAAEAGVPFPFTVHLKGYNKGQGPPGPRVTFDFIVRRGDAIWQVRRRYRQVWEIHSALTQGLGRSVSRLSMPRPPPRVTPRSLVYGQEDDRFLQHRAQAIERYLQDLLHLIPNVEFCEVLWSFFCCVNLARSWQYGGPVCGGTPPVDAGVVAQLPRARGALEEVDADGEAPICVVCQEAMHVGSKGDDVRELPCGHLFHFRCISRWLASRNTCCMCNSSAVPTAPHLAPLLWG